MLIDCAEYFEETVAGSMLNPGRGKPSEGGDIGHMGVPSNETYDFSLILEDSQGIRYNQTTPTQFEGLGYATPSGEHVSWKDVVREHDKDVEPTGLGLPGGTVVTGTRSGVPVRSCEAIPRGIDDEQLDNYANVDNLGAGGFAIIKDHVSVCLCVPHQVDIKRESEGREGASSRGGGRKGMG